MRLFIDTEFTNLDTPNLISIGIVSEDGHEFYREMSNGWTLASCSLFVLGWVLPLLSNGQTYNVLYSNLKGNMDLIQHKTDNANLFPESKIPSLLGQIEADPDLSSHHDFLNADEKASMILAIEDPFLKEGLRGLRPSSILMGDQAQNANQVALDLCEWVDSITDSPIFCSDSNYDKEQLLELLGEEFTFLRLNIQAGQNSGLRPHHALDDARALRASYLKNFSDQERPHQEK